MTKKEISSMLKQQRAENLEDMKKLLLEFRMDSEKNRKADRKYLDKKLREQTDEVNDILDRQDLERARILSKNKQETIEAVEKINFKHRSKIMNQIDPILKEVTASREERIITSARLDKVEEKLQISA